MRAEKVAAVRSEEPFVASRLAVNVGGNRFIQEQDFVKCITDRFKTDTAKIT